MVKIVNLVSLVLLCLLLSPMFGIVSSEIPLSELIEPENDGTLDRSSFVAYSGDGNLLAISYENRNEVYLFHTITREELEISPIVLNDEVRSLEFTEDSSNQGSGYLLVGRESELTNTPAVSIYSLSNWGHTWTEDGVSVTSIITINDLEGNSFAYATRSGNNEYINQYLFSNTDEHLVKIKTDHTSKISCLDYDPVNNLFISGSNEKVQLFSVNGQLVEEIDEIGMEIYDCKFSKEGNYAWSSQDGVKIRDSNHDFLHSYSFPNGISAKKIIFDKNLDKMHLLTNKEGNELATYETNGSWDLIDSLLLGHATNDLEINPANGDIAASTNSQYVAVYASEWLDPRISDSTTNDLDHDGISDQEDEDRDGDGILNVYDVDCESTNPCNLVPDTNFIRNVDVKITNNRLILTENIFFTSEFSESLRLITSEAINENGYIEPDERILIENSFCSKIDQSLIFESWYPVFSFDNNSILAGSSSVVFRCDGLKNLNHDSAERLSLGWEMSFELAHETSNSYNLTINQPPALKYGSPANLVHSYPINLKVTGEDIKTYAVDTWFDTTAPFSLEFTREIEEPAIEINTLINFLKYSSYVMVSISAIVLVILVISRYNNRFKIEDYSPETKRTPPSIESKQIVKKSPPPSRRDKSKEYDYYNPGKRSKSDWNYGDDGGFYYSETYTDYKKASDSVQNPVKIRKVKVKKDVADTPVENRQNRRRVIRKKTDKSEILNKSENNSSEQSTEVTNINNLEVEEVVRDKTDDLDNVNNLDSSTQIKNLMLEKYTQESDVSDLEEEEMMDKALDKFFKK